ncbi:ComF family protein [Anoxybacteroides rupiense]|uniref:ComF family protein n=1 Tax=Anoxybacteroides rupiense TaxID=311460 RepID=A0ABD5IV33_9BACL|nr:ComF family protein [Anoxybacillus rupiensis]
MSEHCLLCHRRYGQRMSWRHLLMLKQTDVLCHECRRSFALIAGDLCECCGRPFDRVDESYRQGELCADCVRWKHDNAWRGVLTKNRSVYVYDAFMKEVIARWKFRGDYALVEAFRTDMCREFFCHFPRDSLLVPIPLSSARLYERGFNQAKALAELLGCPILDALERFDSAKQSKKSRHERLETDRVFHLRSDVSLPAGASFVLIDDIYTTGTTVRHAARMLREAGAAAVSSFTLARS